jgi:hypothetical protein
MEVRVIDDFRTLSRRKRALLIALLVFLTPILVLAPVYRHKWAEQRAQQLEQASAAISNAFEGYTAALKSGNLLVAYGYFSRNFQNQISLQEFRAKQLSLGPLIGSRRGLTRVRFMRRKNSLVRQPFGLVLAELKYGSDTSYLTIGFELEKGQWRIASVEQGKGEFEQLRFSTD